MEWIESVGDTISDAVDNALDTLGIHKDEIEFEVLTEPKKGLLGLGSSQARIRARVKPISREKPKSKQRRGSDRKSSSTAKNNRKPQKGKTSKKKENAMEENEKAVSEKEETKREFAAPLETQADYAKDFLGGLVKYFDSDCKISTEIEEEVIHVAVEGKQVGLLIGSRGATLFALEELMRAVVQAKVGGFTARMYLDVGEYRAKRKEALADFATNLAAKVKETGRVQVLEPMVASDRKIVHDVIAEIDGITTTSEGYDPKRRVVVMVEEAN